MLWIRLEVWALMFVCFVLFFFRQGVLRSLSWGLSPSCAHAAAAQPAWRSRMSRSEWARGHTNFWYGSKLAVYRVCFCACLVLSLPLFALPSASSANHTHSKLLPYEENEVLTKLCVCCICRLCFTKGHFPKLAECAHFHYENVDFGTIQVQSWSFLIPSLEFLNALQTPGVRKG